MFTEILALIVSYLGVFVGYGLSNIAKEEVKHGQDNLLKLQKLIGVLAAVWIFYSNFPFTNIIIPLVSVLSLISLFYIPKYNYATLGLLFGVNPDFVTSGLLFIYGFPTGSLMFRDDYFKIIKKTWLYLLLGVIGLLIRNYFLI